MAYGELYMIFVSKKGNVSVGRKEGFNGFTIKKIKVPNPIIQVGLIDPKSHHGYLLDIYGYVWQFIIYQVADTFNLKICSIKEIPILVESIYTSLKQNFFISNEFTIDERMEKNIFLPVKTISCGYDHVIAICEDHTVWSKGSNKCGQLGLNDTYYRTDFDRIDIPNGDIVNSIDCGQDHSFFLTNSHNVYVCGDNSKMQLGLKQNITQSESLLLNSDFGLISIILCSNYKSFCVDIQGTLMMCGEDLPIQFIFRYVDFICIGSHDNILIQITDGNLWEHDTSAGTMKKLRNPKNKPLCGNRDLTQDVFHIVKEMKEQFVREKKKTTHLLKGIQF